MFAIGFGFQVKLGLWLVRVEGGLMVGLGAGLGFRIIELSLFTTDGNHSEPASVPDNYPQATVHPPTAPKPFNLKPALIKLVCVLVILRLQDGAYVDAADADAVPPAWSASFCFLGCFK